MKDKNYEICVSVVSTIIVLGLMLYLAFLAIRAGAIEWFIVGFFVNRVDFALKPIAERLKEYEKDLEK